MNPSDNDVFDAGTDVTDTQEAEMLQTIKNSKGTGRKLKPTVLQLTYNKLNLNSTH